MTNILPMVGLRVCGEQFNLPSQDGQRGRPRKHGRAYVRTTFVGETVLDFSEVRAAVAAYYGLPVTQIARYTREEIPGRLWAFIVPSLGANQGQYFDGIAGNWLP